MCWSPLQRVGNSATGAMFHAIPIEVFGYQPDSEWNMLYRERCHHPLEVRSEEGDSLGAALREGQFIRPGGGEFELPILRRVRSWADRVWLRIDAGFPPPEMLSALEGASLRGQPE